MSNPNHRGFSTRAIHDGYDPSEWPGSPVNPGIVLSSTFKQKSPGDQIKYEYSRSGNPTRDVLEKSLAGLEGAKFALAFSSGLAAESCAVHLLKSGDHILCMDDVYGGTNRLFNKVFTKLGIHTKMVNCADLTKFKQALTKETKMVWIESPTNPNLKIVDIAGIRSIIQETFKDIILVVDNTFLTPYFQLPLSLGADIVIHSLTKYINGHSDVVMGCLMMNDEKLFNELKFYQNSVGFVPSPFDCFLVLRGMKTLSIRMEKHQSSAMEIAKYFENHQKIKKVKYPGLKSFKQHDLCKSQSSGFGGMIVFKLKTDLNGTKRFLSALKIFSVAESLGGYESLIEIPSIMTHASVPEDQRKLLKIDDSFVRISVGLEDTKDLIQDLEHALDRI